MVVVFGCRGVVAALKEAVLVVVVLLEAVLAPGNQVDVDSVVTFP